MKLPIPCGPVSEHVIELITGRRDGAEASVVDDQAVLFDRDSQLALWIVYELSYRGFESVDPAHEWDPNLVGFRLQLEQRFEAELRASTRDRLHGIAHEDPLGDQLLDLVASEEGPALAAYLRREATREQMVDFLRERSVQQLKESDPQSFLLPRLRGAAKVALAEIQYDEYGAGRVENLHQALYARTLDAVGLDPTYGVYIDEISAVSLASANVMSLFAMNRRLLGAGVGHFAAFEASSAVPSRRIASGMERLELGAAAAAYFLEHVEADSVHEQVAARDLCESYVSDHPGERRDVLFGAACALHLDSLSAAELLARWTPAEVDREQAS